MAKKVLNGNTEAEATSTQSETQQGQPVETAPATVNRTLHFKRNHPQNRASYGVAGVAGIVVCQRDLFAGTTPFTSNTDLAGMPATLELPVDLVSPKADNKQAKAEEAARKAEEKAVKAKEKADAAQKKIEERAAKAKAALEAAQAKAAAATPAAATTEPETPQA